MVTHSYTDQMEYKDIFAAAMQALLIILTSVFTLIFGWRLYDARVKKTIAEKEKIEAEKMQVMLDTWKAIAEDFREQVKTLTGQVKKLTLENQHLSNQLEQIKKTINKQK